MLINHPAIVIGAISATPSFAQSTAKDAFVSAMSGGVSVGALVLVVVIYKLGKLAFTRMMACLSGRTFVQELTVDSALVEGGSL